MALKALLIGLGSAAADHAGKGDFKAAVSQGLAELGFRKGSPDLCVLTNPPISNRDKNTLSIHMASMD